MNRLPARTAFACAILSFALPFVTAADDHAVHLILLSGQSNMANLDPDSVLVPGLVQHFGPDNVVVVKVAQKGQPIRRWFKGWKVTGDQDPNQVGDLSERLITEARAALGPRSIRSATLVWMQGERDAKERLADRYEEAFRGLLDQIQTDLGVAKLNYVIGRLNDSGVGKPDWDEIRRIQQRLGEAGPHAAWVNTDDLNDDPTPSRRDDLHFSKAGYDILAQRYVTEIKALVK